MEPEQIEMSFAPPPDQMEVLSDRRGGSTPLLEDLSQVLSAGLDDVLARLRITAFDGPPTALIFGHPYVVIRHQSKPVGRRTFDDHVKGSQAVLVALSGVIEEMLLEFQEMVQGAEQLAWRTRPTIEWATLTSADSVRFTLCCRFAVWSNTNG